MPAIMISPHNDDVALFAAFMCHRLKPTVVTVFDSYVQEERHGEGRGLDRFSRRGEDRAALEILRCSNLQFAGVPDLYDGDQLTDAVQRCLPNIKSWGDWDEVWLPLPEDGGHAQHNLVGQYGRVIWPNARFYTTYTTRGRSIGSVRITPSPEEIRAKHLALACYRSQIELEATRPHFMGGLDEYACC